MPEKRLGDEPDPKREFDGWSLAVVVMVLIKTKNKYFFAFFYGAGESTSVRFKSRVF